MSNPTLPRRQFLSSLALAPAAAYAVAVSETQKPKNIATTCRSLGFTTNSPIVMDYPIGRAPIRWTVVNPTPRTDYAR